MAMAHRARTHGSDAAKADCLRAATLRETTKKHRGSPDAAGEFFDYRTVGSIVAAARRNKVLERTPHVVQRPFALPQIGYSGHSQCFDVGACTRLVAPERQQLADLVDWKTKVAGAGDEPQSMHITGRIIPILRIRSQRLWRQPDLFIVAHHPRAETCRGGCLADVHQIPLDLDTMSTPTLRRDA